ncbi:protein SUPPRESSOR OF K(+) TRANSPORT GROWTH DEFECT 1 isoform X3 [Rosa chinensis]|uniref:protein SUPPRESSOR OF K(+) TRANSPORT GROWTH DEFECT 1 isoform X3 n=1 Tax=Rosa chinensis TaxID=74649 RepID=UPI000D094BA2|nr:protein SUPPRESSOR OF K(+) TRANSPORT GROWTH DEFECT 1 isoform X3 [Rosa chinensis]XP_024167323.1 protein SUPPRESSOR OF K(+) TRANSPORT GROWTH DEFECT 1 isoform X3 [Rosa chinensis]
MEIRIVLDDDGPGPASNGDAAVVTSLKTKPEDGEGSGKEDPEQTKLRAGLNLSVKFPQFFTALKLLCKSFNLLHHKLSSGSPSLLQLYVVFYYYSSTLLLCASSAVFASNFL